MVLAGVHFALFNTVEGERDTEDHRQRDRIYVFALDPGVKAKNAWRFPVYRQFSRRDVNWTLKLFSSSSRWPEQFKQVPDQQGLSVTVNSFKVEATR